MVTSDPARRAQVAVDVPEAQVLDTPEALWARAADHDLVVVATPTPSHTEMTLAALKAGLPVVVEKPVAVTVADARRVAEAARRSRLPVVPFHNRRWDSDHLTMQRLVAEGALGRVLRYESRFERWRPSVSAFGWRDDLPGPQGGGVLLDLGVHLVDQALALFGPADEVYAEIDARRAVADDDVFVALAHRSGVRSHLWAGAVCAAPGPRLRVLGTDAAFVVAGLDGQEESLRNGSSPDDEGFGLEPPERWGCLRRGEADSQPVPSERGRWGSFYPAVSASLHRGAPPPVALDDALTVQLVLDAARRSASSGQVVTISSR